ncbi:hypothetical protein HMPREF0198_0681, partial [Cardiobacterium hominis ATCC 15826]
FQPQGEARSGGGLGWGSHRGFTMNAACLTQRRCAKAHPMPGWFTYA